MRSRPIVPKIPLLLGVGGHLTVKLSKMTKTRPPEPRPLSFPEDIPYLLNGVEGRLNRYLRRENLVRRENGPEPRKILFLLDKIDGLVDYLQSINPIL